MAAISIYPMTRSHKPDVDAHLPTFYMNDYSIMGLRVDRLDDTRTILDNHYFSVTETAGGIVVEICSFEGISEICGMLEAQGIEWAITDLVENIYQG